MFMKVIERETGVEYRAEAIEGGYQIYTLKGESYKKLRESTFKRYFKPMAEEKDAQVNKAQPKEEKRHMDENTKSTAKQQKPEPQVHEEISAEKREKMIDKIKKMLALAENNPSMEEGLSAALQAQKLMAKYNIHEEDVTLEEIKDEICSVFTQQKHNSHLLSWRKTLASIVAKNFRCKCYLSGQDVVFRGYKKDAEIALEVYLSLYTIGNQLASKAYAEQKERIGTGKGAYTSYVTGFLTGVDEGLSVQCTALMIIVPKEVEEEYAQFSAGFKTSKTTLRVNNAELYNKGKAEGKAAVKSRSIEKKGE